MKKRFILIFASVMLGAAMLAGCNNAKDNSSAQQTTQAQENTEATTEAAGSVKEDSAETTTLDSETQAKLDKLMRPATKFPQLEGVKKGDTVATIHTSMGDIKVWFFPEYAPKAVENFTTHAKDGYYNNVIFHRVINNFMIQGGDPEGTGMGGESIWGEPFEVEPSFELRHFRGALCMAKSSDPVSIGSQFYIVQNPTLSDGEKTQLEQLKGKLDEVYYKSDDGKTQLTLGESYFPEPVIDEYIKNGGYPSLDLQYTVFGQVYEGMDVVDKIAAVKTNESDKPEQDVVIKSVEVGTFQG